MSYNLKLFWFILISSTLVLSVGQNRWVYADEQPANDYFGASVTLDGDTVLVGASWNGDDGNNSSLVYVFTRSDTAWSQQAKLTAEDAAAKDLYCVSVVLNGDTALVGTHYGDGNKSGTAYVFTRSGTAWSRQAKLTAGDAAEDDHFGISVALNGDTALVGAPYDDDGGSDSSSAYVFTRSGTAWSLQAKLTAGDAAADDGFGRSVALDGDSALVGAWGHSRQAKKII